jgi:hypothetical protein
MLKRFKLEVDNVQELRFILINSSWRIGMVLIEEEKLDRILIAENVFYILNPLFLSIL